MKNRKLQILGSYTPCLLPAVKGSTCYKSTVKYTRRVRPPNGGRNEANSWETGSVYSSGETYTAAAMRAAGRPRRATAHRPAPACGLARPAGPRWPLHAGIY